VERQVAKTAVVGPDGQFLAGPVVDGELDWAALVKDLRPGQARLISPVLATGGLQIGLEKLSPDALDFWKRALDSQENSWAAWLLTLTEDKGDQVQVVRHILAALGPWTTPRTPVAPPGQSHQWSLTPLNAGLGALLTFGDDDLALETAALGARAGLLVTLITTRAAEDLRAAQSVGEFSCRNLTSWLELNAENLEEFGLKPGVFVLVTTQDNASFIAAIQAAPTGWFGLAGGAAVSSKESGLFPEALTPAQKALGLLAAMLEK
jgi:hypothetical protein